MMQGCFIPKGQGVCAFCFFPL